MTDRSSMLSNLRTSRSPASPSPMSPSFASPSSASPSTATYGSFSSQQGGGIDFTLLQQMRLQNLQLQEQILLQQVQAQQAYEALQQHHQHQQLGHGRPQNGRERSVTDGGRDWSQYQVPQSAGWGQRAFSDQFAPQPQQQTSPTSRLPFSGVQAGHILAAHALARKGRQNTVPLPSSPPAPVAHEEAFQSFSAFTPQRGHHRRTSSTNSFLSSNDAHGTPALILSRPGEEFPLSPTEGKKRITFARSAEDVGSGGGGAGRKRSGSVSSSEDSLGGGAGTGTTNTSSLESFESYKEEKSEEEERGNMAAGLRGALAGAGGRQRPASWGNGVPQHLDFGGGGGINMGLANLALAQTMSAFTLPPLTPLSPFANAFNPIIPPQQQEKEKEKRAPNLFAGSQRAEGNVVMVLRQPRLPPEEKELKARNFKAMVSRSTPTAPTPATLAPQAGGMTVNTNLRSPSPKINRTPSPQTPTMTRKGSPPHLATGSGSGGGSWRKQKDNRFF